MQPMIQGNPLRRNRPLRTGLWLAGAALLAPATAARASDDTPDASASPVPFAAQAAARANGAHDTGTPAAEAVAERPDSAPITVTARRRAEAAQDVPIALSVVGADQIEATGSFNVGRLQQLLPTLQFYSSNPRNTAVNIRGLGAPFGLTNDGIEQGVGIYIDQVYYARVAASTFDFLDVAQIETLRGPQGTLYGKNTAAGALNITTRQPTFTPEARAELSFGNLGYVQAKAAVSGPLSERVAVRLTGSATHRQGTLTNVTTGSKVNELDNLGLRGQLLWRATDRLDLTFSADYNRQNPECCAQLYVRVAPTLRSASRRYANLAALSGYAPASTNPFDRLVDADTPLRAKQEFGGASLRAVWDLGAASLTAISAWRYWDWDPSNDRDYTGLPVTTISANPSKQRQLTQEFRLASQGNNRLDYTVGLFGFRQTIHSTGVQEQGSAASLWLLGPTNGADPALLDGLRQETDIDYSNNSAALYGRLTWHATDRLRIEPGLRLNYDSKKATYRAVVSGGLDTTDATLIALKNSVLQSQYYDTRFSDWNVSGDISLSWKATQDILLYGTYAHSFKSGGVNLSGIPNRTDGTPATEVATVKPESIDHFELGLKSQFANGAATLNLAAFRTEIGDYQATVVNGAVGVLRGYLANARKVRTQGVEVDATLRPTRGLLLRFSGAYTDATYVDFADAPPPVELSGGSVQSVDISGARLPGVSKWAFSYGADYTLPARLFGLDGAVFAGVDGSYRSRWSSSPTPSAYMMVDGYALTNGRLGYRTDSGWEASLWVRNAFDVHYFDYLTAASGSTGLIVGQPGDPRTYGLTLKTSF